MLNLKKICLTLVRKVLSIFILNSECPTMQENQQLIQITSSQAEQSHVEHAAAVGQPVQEATQLKQKAARPKQGAAGSKLEAAKLKQG